MGGVLTCAAFHAQTGHFAPQPAFLSLPAVITVGCILLVNNTSDLEKDHAGGRRTLSVCIGRRASRILLRTSVILAASGVIAILLLRFPGGWAAAAVLSGWLLCGNGFRILLVSPVLPAQRRENMTAILNVHKWIIGCYTAGILLDAFLLL